VVASDQVSQSQPTTFAIGTIAPQVVCITNSNCTPVNPPPVITGTQPVLPKLPDFSEKKSTTEAQEVLRSIERATGVKPAIIYANFRPYTDELDLILVTSKGDPIYKPIRVRKEVVVKVVENLRLAITDPLNDDLEPSQRMYDWLVRPLLADLKANGINNLLFITDEGLRSAPLAALHDGKKYLIEDYSVGFAPSLSLTDTRYTDIKKFAPVALGASEFKELRALPSVPAELSVVTNESSDRVYLNQAFTLDNVSSLSSKYRIVHFATHGEFNEENYNNSYIQLWGDRKLRFADLRQLELYEIPGKRPAVELLVLSACQTALDKNSEFGFGGLAAQTGAKTVLASLWTVDDAGTLGLMTEFYSRLKKAPIKSEALRQAQLSMLRGETRIENGKVIASNRTVTIPAASPDAKVALKKLSHPFYWSAFTMIGNPW
jgi:CHAT domain-containing protein